MPLFDIRRRVRAHRYMYGHKHPMRVMTGTYFIVTMAVSALWVFWSPLVDSFTKSPQLTGLVSGLLVALGIIYTLVLPEIGEKLSHKRMLIGGLLIAAISLLLMAILKDFWAFLVLAALMQLGFMMRNLGVASLTRDASSKKTISKNQAIRWFFNNIAYFIGPLAMAFLFTGENFTDMLYLTAILIFISATVGTILIAPKKHKEVAANPFSHFKEYWRSRERTLTFLMRLGLSMLFGYVNTYLPLTIIYRGYPASWIGYAMFLITIPLMLLEYPIGKAAPQLTFRRVFMTGFTIAGALFIVAGFIKSLPLFIAIIVGAMVGAAFLEPTIESYFFKISKREEEAKYLGIYLSSNRVGNVSGKLLGALLLFFLPLEGLTLGFGILLLGFAVLARKVRH